LGKLKQVVNLAAFAAGRCAPITGPAKVTWEVTYRCNMRCKHCHLWQVREHDELSTEEAKAFIADVKRAGALHMSFSGGEPFLRGDMFELAAYASSLGLSTAVNTNGTRLVTSENARRLCDMGMGTVFISLDGPDAKTHNELRGRSHAFDSALHAIDNLIAQRNGGAPRVFINTTLTRHNTDSLERILALGREHGVDGMTMSILQDVGKYSPEAEAAVDGFSVDGLAARLHTLADGSGGLIPHSHEYMDNFTTYLRRPNDLYKYRCVAGYATVLVHPDGEVQPCPVAFAKMGSLREKSFSEIWFSDEANKLRQKIKAGNHPICWFDCIAPISVFLHNLSRLRIDRVLDRKTLAHIWAKSKR
jgi:AdoMet-dependent heme synthase